MNQNQGNDAEFPLQGLTLLLADDEIRLRQILHLMAEELGANVIAVDSCEKALDIYKKKSSEIDIVLLDLRMSGMSGETAYREIRAYDSNAKIVLSSGIPPEREFIEGLHKNGCEFIEKPFDMDQLGDVLFRVATG